MSWRVDPEQLVTAAEIAERLDYKQRQAIYAWARRYPDFPRPVLKRTGIQLWLWPEVEEWCRRTGRL